MPLPPNTIPSTNSESGSQRCSLVPDVPATWLASFGEVIVALVFGLPLPVNEFIADTCQQTGFRHATVNAAGVPLIKVKIT